MYKLARPLLGYSVLLVVGCATQTAARGEFVDLAPDPATCNLPAIGRWMHQLAREKFSYKDDYSDAKVGIQETDEGWVVYLQRFVDGRISAGGSPEALLDKERCHALKIYWSQ